MRPKIHRVGVCGQDHQHQKVVGSRWVSIFCWLVIFLFILPFFSFSFPSLILSLAFPLLFYFFGNCRLFSFLELAGRTVSPASCLSFWPVHGLSGPLSLSGAPFISVQWRGLSKGWPAANSSHDRKQNNQKFGSANSFFSSSLLLFFFGCTRKDISFFTPKETKTIDTLQY